MLIYPENYVTPEPVAKIKLTAGQRATLKTKMKAYLTAKGEPVESKELIEDAHAYVLEQTGKHIHSSVYEEVALEILEEWPAPVSEIDPEII